MRIQILTGLIVTRKASQRRMIVAAITALYLLVALQVGLQWWLIEWQFIEHGDTRVDIFVSYFDPPVWFDLLERISMLAILVLSDGLLVSNVSTPRFSKSHNIIDLEMLSCMAGITSRVSAAVFPMGCRAQ